MSTRLSGVATDIYFTTNPPEGHVEHHFFIQNQKHHLQIPCLGEIILLLWIIEQKGVDASFKINMKKSGFATELYLDQKDISDMSLQKILLKTQNICLN